MSRIRVAVIGLGVIAQSVHLPLLRRNADVFDINALVDLSAVRVRQMCERYGVPHGYGSVDSLVAGIRKGDVVVDAAIVATSGSHAADVVRLLGVGVKVLAEKPLAYSKAEASEILKLCRDRDLDVRDWIRIGYMKEYDEASRRAAEALRGKRVRAIAVQVLHPLDASQFSFARLLAPSTDITDAMLSPTRSATAAAVATAIGDGVPQHLRVLYTNVVLGSIIHDVGLLRMVAGGIGEVRYAEHWGSRMPGSVHLRGTMSDGAVPWTIDWHYIDDYPDYCETVVFHHEAGSVELRFGVPYIVNSPTRLTVTDREPELGVRVSESQWAQQEAFENELFELAGLVRGNSSRGPSVAEAFGDIEVGQRMIRVLAASENSTIGGEAGALD